MTMQNRMTDFRMAWMGFFLATGWVLDGPALAAEGLQALKDREAKVQAVYERVSPSVVALGSAEQRPGWGSGVIVDPKGLIYTAGHVTEATGQDVWVHLADGRRLRGKTLGANMDRDASLVMLITNGEESFPYVDIAPPDTTKEGDWVVAMGHPGGYDPRRPAPLRVGKLLQKQGENLLVTDCTLAGGDSGGPLFDLEGRLIGIHSSISNSLSHNMHVAIAVYHRDQERMQKGENWGELTQLFEQPLPGTESQLDRTKNRAILGAQLDTRQENGVLVRDVKPGFPADEGGLQAGDTIVQFNETEVENYPDLFGMLSETEPGEKVRLKIQRRGDELEVVITMGDRHKLLPNR